MTNNRVNFIPIAETEKTPKVELEYNNKTYKSYVKLGLITPDNLDVQEKQFLSLVEPTEENPIERTVTRIVRLRAPYHTSKRMKKKSI
jgi:hypothetical protein